MRISDWSSDVCSSDLADDALVLRRLDGDAGQLGGGGDQGFEREIDAGRDDAALVGARIIDHVERGGGAEIYDDEVARMERVGGDGVEHAIGPDRVRLADVELHAPFRRRLSRDDGLGAETFRGEDLQILPRLGTERGAE